MNRFTSQQTDRQTECLMHRQSQIRNLPTVAKNSKANVNAEHSKSIELGTKVTLSYHTSAVHEMVCL